MQHSGFAKTSVIDRTKQGRKRQKQFGGRTTVVSKNFSLAQISGIYKVWNAEPPALSKFHVKIVKFGHIFHIWRNSTLLKGVSFKKDIHWKIRLKLSKRVPGNFTFFYSFPS